MTFPSGVEFTIRTSSDGRSFLMSGRVVFMLEEPCEVEDGIEAAVGIRRGTGFNVGRDHLRRYQLAAHLAELACKLADELPTGFVRHLPSPFGRALPRRREFLDCE